MNIRWINNAQTHFSFSNWLVSALPQEDAAPHQEEPGILWTLYQLLRPGPLRKDSRDFPGADGKSKHCPVAWQGRANGRELRQQTVNTQRQWWPAGRTVNNRGRGEQSGLWFAFSHSSGRAIKPAQTRHRSRLDESLTTTVIGKFICSHELKCVAAGFRSTVGENSL